MNNKSNVSQWGNQWGDNIDWSKLNYTESYGRKFIRHPSDMGTVMSMNDGTERNILVLDAKYRKTSGYAYYTNGKTDLGLYKCQNIDYFTGSEQSFPYTGISDELLNKTVANQDINTSKYNTDNLVGAVEAVTSVPEPILSQAANYCRSIKISYNGIEIGCDMPNINVLCRLYAAMIKLDSMDPTVSSYSDVALSNWWSSRYRCCWSSSWCGYDILDYYALSLNRRSYVCDYAQNYSDPGIAVILEI